jgi:hypothetical protein
MKPTRFVFAVLMLFACFTANRAIAQQGTWEKLGSRKVDHRVDHDEILVTWVDGAFDAIKIEVTGAPLNMHRCVVHFANGGEQEILTRHNFTQGSGSRVIDLKGNNRIINRISFTYDTQGLLRGKATITVFGRH